MEKNKSQINLINNIMKYYGIHVDCHDANVTILDENGNLEFFAESERYFPRIKKYQKLDNIINFFPRPKKEDIVCINYPLNCYCPLGYEEFISSIVNENCKNLNNFLVKKLLKANTKKYFEHFIGYDIKPNFILSHHLCHVLSSWAYRQNDTLRFCLSCDGGGIYASGDHASSLGGFISKEGFELCELQGQIFSSIVLDSLLGKHSAGKSMGAAGYFNDNEGFSNEEAQILIKSIFFHKSKFDIIGKPINPNFKLTGQQDDEKILKLVGKFYSNTIEEIWKSIKFNLEFFIKNKSMGVVIGGGTHLALELNTKITDYAEDVVFGPPVSDCGISLGAAIYGYYLDKGHWPPSINTPSIAYLQTPLPEVGSQEPKEIAQILANNEVIGLLRGKAECGPRSLGFRSVLANAGDYENLKRVSQDLKEREYYRPLAPMVTEESFDKYFIGPKGEYMQYKCDCTSDAIKEVPAIVHKDNSSRPQVVFKDRDPWLHELLVEYGKLTGSECLINTSLNGPGKPICNTYEDAVEDFKEKNIKLISIKNKSVQ